MKKSAKSRIIVWSIVSVVLIAVLVSSIVIAGKKDFSLASFLRNDSYSTADSVDITNETAEFDANEINNINVIWSSGDVKINVAKTENIFVSVKAYKAKNKNDVVHYSKENGTLSIYSEKQGGFNLFNDFSSKEIVITLPEDKLFDNIDVSTASAEAEINDANVENVNMNTASGNISIMNSQGNEIKMNSASGDIDIAGCNFTDIQSNAVSGETTVEGTFATFDSESVSGSVNINAHNECNKIDCETVSGSINITLPKSLEAVNVDFDSVSGNLNSEFGTTTSANSTQIDLETVSGSATVRKAM